MKWYKHMTNTDASGLVTELVEALGIAGYGLFFRLLEVLASKCEAPDWSTSLRLTRAGWQRRLYCQAQDLQTFIDIAQEWAEADRDAGRQPPLEIRESGKWTEIEATKLLDYADRYTADVQSGRAKKTKKAGKSGPGPSPAKTVEPRAGTKTPSMVCTEQEQKPDSVCTEPAQKVHPNRLEQIRLDSSSSGTDGDDSNGKAKQPELAGPWAGIPAWLVNPAWTKGSPETAAALQRAFPDFNYSSPNPHLVDRINDILTSHPRTAIEQALAISGANEATSVVYLEKVLADKAQSAVTGNRNKLPPPASKFAYNPKTGATRLFRTGDALAEGEELL